MSELFWTKEQKETLAKLWPNESAYLISKKLGKTRNAVIGAAYRMKLPIKKRPKAAIPASADKPRYVNPVLVVSRPAPEPMPVEQPWSGKGVPMLDAGYGQCRAVIGSTDALNETVMVCGDPIVEGQTFSFCRHHLERYTQPSYRRRVFNV